MECRYRVLSALKTKARAYVRASRSTEVRDQCIDHDVSDQDRLSGNVLVTEVHDPRLLGDVKEVRKSVRLDPVVLLWHAEIEASQSRLYMSDRNSKAPGDSGARHGRIHVTNHEYEVGRFLLHDWREAFFNERNLLQARKRTDLERDFRARYS